MSNCVTIFVFLPHKLLRMKKILLTFITIISIVSCDIKEKGIDVKEKINIESRYGNQVITDYDIPIKATDVSGNDISAQTIFYVDGQQQTNNVLRFSASGTHQITAKITADGETKESDPLTLNVIDPQSSTKVLVEDFTGTWCVNCPRVAYKLEEAVNQNGNIVPTAIHASPVPGQDPFSYANFSYFLNTYGIQAFPSPLVDRNYVWDENFSTLQTELNKNKPMGLAISSTINGNNIDVTVKVRFDMNFSDEDLNLIVYLNENGLHHDQDNGTTYYGGQNPIPNFEHNHTLRFCFTGESGESIDNNKEANQIYIYHYTGTIPSNIDDINNCEIVAFTATNDNPIKAINVQNATINTTKDFD